MPLIKTFRGNDAEKLLTNCEDKRTTLRPQRRQRSLSVSHQLARLGASGAQIGRRFVALRC